MTLRELAEQYQSDVETRLKVVQDERANVDDPLCYCEEYMDDLDKQEAHWQATLAHIKEVLAENPVDAARSCETCEKQGETICPGLSCVNADYDAWHKR